MKAKFVTQNEISFEVESSEEALLLEGFLDMDGKLEVWDVDAVYLTEGSGVKKVVIVKSNMED